MADMHPHRRAQLELEAAQQAANPRPMQKSAAELAAAIFSVSGAATGANSEPAGAMQRQALGVREKTSSMQSAPREPRAMRAHKITKPTMSKRATHRKKEELRVQIKEADRAGNYDFAEDCFDELEAIKEAHRAKRAEKNSDPKRLARRAKSKAARAERVGITIANGTYLTPEERRAKRKAALEARLKADPVFAAQEAEKMKVRKAKEEQTRENIAAVARYTVFRKQSPRQRTLEQKSQLSQGQWHAQYGDDQEQQALWNMAGNGEQASAYPSYHSHEYHLSQNEHRQSVPRYFHNQEQQDALCEDYQQDLRARYEDPQTTLSRRMDRINIDDRFSDSVSTDEDGDTDVDVEMEDIASPLSVIGHERNHSELLCPSPIPWSAQLQVGGGGLRNEPIQGLEAHRPTLLRFPMLAEDAVGGIDPATRPGSKHGDGSKQFLDPDSTAYKMMARMGWAHGKGLGKDGAGVSDTIKVTLKRDRKGLQYGRANSSPVREVQQPAPNSIAAAGGITKLLPKSTSAQMVGNHPINNRHTVIDLTQDEPVDPVVSDGPSFIDLTQDIFVDLTGEDDTGNPHSDGKRSTATDLSSPSSDARGWRAAADVHHGLGSRLSPTVLNSAAYAALKVSAVGGEQMGDAQDVADR